MTAWVQMLVTMADGPSQAVHGVVVPYRNSDKPFRFYYGTYEPVVGSPDLIFGGSERP